MTTPSSSAERHSHPSVVVASAGKLERLWRAVEALEAECTRTGAQLVIARSASRDEERVVRQRLRHATVVWAPPGVGIPRLRGLGLAAATGDPVAITEDHLLASVRWLDRLFAPVRAGFDIVGGGCRTAWGAMPWRGRPISPTTASTATRARPPACWSRSSPWPTWRIGGATCRASPSGAAPGLGRTWSMTAWPPRDVH
ncbi:MAG: glycosyltransferase family 2 protein [Gemmatimonadetes bacterium]|nr:glycosyltransferase family 2 protein [Gemmatimonadota bacterium]